MITSLFNRSKNKSVAPSEDQLTPDLSRIFPHLRDGGAAPAQTADTQTVEAAQVSQAPAPERVDDPEPSLAETVPTEAWLTRDIDALSQAWSDFATRPTHADVRRRLFICAHNLKATAAPFGAPAVARLATSLSRLLEHADTHAPIVSIVNLHVQAVQAAGSSGSAAADDLAQAVCVALEDQVDALVSNAQ